MPNFVHARYLLMVTAGLLLAGCGQTTNSNNGTATSAINGNGGGSSQQPSQMADQAGAPLEPDAHLTPGATLDVTVEDIAVPGYTQKVRNVPQDVKKQVYAEYGIAQHKPGEYEVDHLISLELGGSNSIKNLWPQSYLTQPWNAHVKDTLENKLHDLVVAGQVPLATAQHDIATDWIAAYKKYLNTDRPLSEGAMAGSGAYTRHRKSHATPHPLTDATPDAASPDASSGNGGQVWVNTRSGKYFQPGSSHYGNTKEGEYLTESQAQQQGFVAAQGQ